MKDLPADLASAENEIFLSVDNILKDNKATRISVDIKFEGLRIMPLVFRLSFKLAEVGLENGLLWMDAGSTALAKRDAPDLAQNIYDVSKLKKGNYSDFKHEILIIVSPQHFDYEEFYDICNYYGGKIIMVNGKLEDFAVGIGSVARERRKDFISSWINAYWLQPLDKGALMHTYPDDWYIYTLDQTGYRFVDRSDKKPNPEELLDYLL